MHTCSSDSREVPGKGNNKQIRMERGSVQTWNEKQISDDLQFTFVFTVNQLLSLDLHKLGIWITVGAELP